MDNEGKKKIVTRIPADESKTSRVAYGKKIKVAAYCRVSTDSEDQMNSYRAQMEYYTKHISENPDWEFVDVYADEGITGTLVKKRENFLRMIRDCEKGKIDMILTKSVSRFARNIVDSLSFVRKLKAMGIAIYFEEQNINSLKEDSETYIGIYSVMAQSESENISANVKWGISKRMENGTYCCNMNMFGYRRDKVTKEVYIVEEEAKVVRSIFQMFLDGKSAGQIKAELEKNGVKTYRGKTEWQPKLITTMLQNEKYCGDVMHQKTYCVDCISKRKKINNGKKTKYLVIDDHPQIISRSMYYAAQSEMARRNAQRSKSEDSISGRGRYSGKHALSELLVCAECGSHYRRKYHKKKDGAHYYWRCISRLENGDKYCSNSKGLEEELLKKTICEALSSVLAKRENGYEVLKSRMIYAAAGDEHSNELYVIEMAISDAMGRIDELTELAVKFKSNRDKYDAAIGECNEQLRVLREKKENILEQLNHNEKARKEMERIEKHLTEDMVVIPEFNDGFIRRMVTSIRVTQDNNLQICIKGGYEIMASFPCDKNAA